METWTAKRKGKFSDCVTESVLTENVCSSEPSLMAILINKSKSNGELDQFNKQLLMLNGLT